MKLIFIMFFLLMAQIAYSINLPHLICQETVKETILLERWLYLGGDEEKSMYVFSNNNFYLSSTLRKEYLYNKIIKAKPLRYQSGFKIIVFSNSF